MNLQKTNIIKVLSILIFLGFWASLAVAIEMDIAALQKVIDARGLKWKAGKTALSDLSLEELKMMFPQKLPQKIRMMPVEERITLPDDFPTFLDWRNYKGGNWITPVKSQIPCGSCYAFATVATMESLIKLHYNDPDLPVDLSEQYMVSCGFSCRGVEWPYMAMDFLVNSGVPDEECFPYKRIQFAGIEPPCTKACSDAALRLQKLSSYSLISGEGVSIPVGDIVAFIPYPENIKAILVNKPVACAMMMGLDSTFYNGGIYEPTGPAFLGHLVEIIGFDDAQQCWICKNSFGTNWGETADFKPYTRGAGDGGYFRVSYVTTENTKTIFGVFAADMNYEGGPPLPTSTTTTICPMIEIYGNDAEETHLLRSFRDKLLTKTPDGKKFIELYYRWSPAVVKILQENAPIKAAVKEKIDSLLPVIKEKQQ